MSENRITWLRCQRKFASKALARYPIKVDRVDLISTDTNLIYRVRDVEGRRYALRLAAHGWRTEDNLRTEVAWLRALARDTEIPVPRIIGSIEGEPYVRLDDSNLGTQRRAILMTWLPGMHLGKRLSPENLCKMGELFAKLHAHARNWLRPADIPRIAFTGFLGRNEPNLLFDDHHGEFLPPHVLAVIKAARRCVEQAYAAKSKTELRIIHGDLWHENIKIYRGELAPIDFEDTILGYEEHDIAMGLLDLAAAVPNEVYETNLRSFVCGYERVASYPQSDILPFQLGRLLWQLNWIAQFRPQNLADAARSNAVILEYALDRGRLQFH